MGEKGKRKRRREREGQTTPSLAPAQTGPGRLTNWLTFTYYVIFIIQMFSSSIAHLCRSSSVMAAAALSLHFSRPLVISGPSGVGKSTLLQRLFSKYLDQFGFSVSRMYIHGVAFNSIDFTHLQTRHHPQSSARRGRWCSLSFCHTRHFYTSFIRKCFYRAC